jgi:hypothetical protein
MPPPRACPCLPGSADLAQRKVRRSILRLFQPVCRKKEDILRSGAPPRIEKRMLHYLGA